ncbi:MAG: ferredoxin [Actinobacteria bacterium]|nr:ferredoxin [Actinomycetota bacterium]
MKIRLDADSCHGHQMCAIAAPELFGSDDYGNAVLLVDGDVPLDQHSKAMRAAGNCPEGAITIEQDSI